MLCFGDCQRRIENLLGHKSMLCLQANLIEKLARITRSLHVELKHILLTLLTAVLSRQLMSLAKSSLQQSRPNGKAHNKLLANNKQSDRPTDGQTDKRRDKRHIVGVGVGVTAVADAGSSWHFAE